MEEGRGRMGVEGGRSNAGAGAVRKSEAEEGVVRKSEAEEVHTNVVGAVRGNGVHRNEAEVEVEDRRNEVEVARCSDHGCMYCKSCNTDRYCNHCSPHTLEVMVRSPANKTRSCSPLMQIDEIHRVDNMGTSCCWRAFLEQNLCLSLY